MLKILKFLSLVALQVGGMCLAAALLGQPNVDQAVIRAALCVGCGMLLVGLVYTMSTAFTTMLSVAMPAIEQMVNAGQKVRNRYACWCRCQDQKIEAAHNRFEAWFNRLLFNTVDRWVDACFNGAQAAGKFIRNMLEHKPKPLKVKPRHLQRALDDDSIRRKKVVFHYCSAAGGISDDLLSWLPMLAAALPDVQFIHTQAEPESLAAHFTVQVSVPAGVVKHFPITLDKRLVISETFNCEDTTNYNQLREALQQRVLVLDAKLTADLHRMAYVRDKQVINPVQEVELDGARTMLQDPSIKRAVVYFCREEGDDRGVQTRHFDYIARSMHDIATFARCRWFLDPHVCSKCELPPADREAGEKDYKVRLEQLRNYPPHFLIQARVPNTNLVERKLVCGALNYKDIEQLLSSTFSEFNTRLEEKVSRQQPLNTSTDQKTPAGIP